MHRGRLFSVAVLAFVAACSDMPKKDVPRPGSAGKPPNPMVTDEPRATPAESSPVPSDARGLIEEYTRGALEPREVALAMETVLAAAKEAPMDAGADWKVSRKRALTHALLASPRELRSELRRYQDERSRFEAASVGTDVKMNRLWKAIPLADRWPCAGFAQGLWARLGADRLAAPKELVDTSLLTAPLPAGGLRLSGIMVRERGEDALVARDADGRDLWEHHARAGASDTPSLRVLGTFADALVVLELSKAGSEVRAVDIMTGNESCRVALPGLKSAPRVGLVGPDLVVVTPRRVQVVDLLRGVVGWERGHAYDTVPTLTEDRVVFGPDGLGFDLSTGRLVEGSAGKPRRQGAVEVR